MKKWLLVPIVAVMLGVTLLSGCAGGLAPAELATAQNRITELETKVAGLATDQNRIAELNDRIAELNDRIAELKPQVEKLSAISAYSIWYDQYYAVGNFIFEDTEAFNGGVGALIAAAGDAASQAAWENYLATDSAFNAVVAGLPEDYEAWTEDQTNQWTEAYNTRYATFGEVGVTLYEATDYSASQIRILELETQVADLSVISAYNIWYDQYYGIYNYTFEDTTTFNWKLGTLIYATNNDTVIGYWNYYYAADSALNEVLAELPEDYGTWTEDQINQWSEANTARSEALGYVGTYLFYAIVGY
ncbi:MAG: hypothetical protein CL875_02005 [Dehalococcoidales bacterium]|nr:hypothetical protein [Dehalococcoidales bacterium]|tara:strand:+ start:851 stop:1762 length:912 start_codon:yes stop_codon:yes gene_type:complete